MRLHYVFLLQNPHCLRTQCVGLEQKVVTVVVFDIHKIVDDHYKFLAQYKIIKCEGQLGGC